MGGRFSWVKPDVYPLIAAVGLACSFAAYSMARNLYTNPDVFLTKESRQAGEPDESVEKRSKGYEKSVFRSIQSGKDNTRIFN